MREMLRLADVKAMLGISRMTIDRLEAAGDFPQRFRIGGKIRWDLAEINEWLDHRPRGIKTPRDK
jgi:predicted DNA-binding transcriptional regulator AlpA